MLAVSLASQAKSALPDILPGASIAHLRIVAKVAAALRKSQLGRIVYPSRPGNRAGCGRPEDRSWSLDHPACPV